MDNGAQNIEVPDGYYTATNSAANTFRITAVANAASVAPDALANNFTVRKVGHSNGGAVVAGGVNFDRNVLSTTNNSKTVRVYIQPGHQYQNGDKFSIRGVNAPNFIVNNLTICNNQEYTVSGTGPNYIDFVSETSPFQANATQTCSIAGPLPNPINQPGLYLDFTDRMFRNLGLSSADADTDLDASYEAGNAAHSLSRVILNH